MCVKGEGKEKKASACTRISRWRDGILVSRLILLRCEFSCGLLWRAGWCTDVLDSVSFVVSGLLVFRADRDTKVTGGVSYA